MTFLALAVCILPCESAADGVAQKAINFDGTSEFAFVTPNKTEIKKKCAFDPKSEIKRESNLKKEATTFWRKHCVTSSAGTCTQPI
jgi:hypothetical protein